MSSAIQRPRFYEGQVLSANDLEAGQDYQRGQQARHNRYLHAWGIAGGLTIRQEKRRTSGTNQEYLDLFLQPGIAIDGRGREIVLDEERQLLQEDFENANVLVAGGWHPVILRYQQEDAAPSALAISACSTGESSRRIEGLAIEFGKPGSELDIAEQTPSAFEDGPDGDPWSVLLGFVQFEVGVGFKAFAEVSEGISRRYAGVQADTVVARSGKLALRSNPESEASTPMAMMVPDEGGQLQFGTSKDGLFTPKVRLTAAGDVIAEGSISGKAIPGKVTVESGFASDGMLLPLPDGITDQDVEDGRVALHIHLTPRVPAGAAPAAGRIPVPRECRVDGRRVFCSVSWLNPAAIAVVDVTPGVCAYLLVVSAPEKGAS